MNSGSAEVREHLGRLFHRGTVAALGESALLERFVAHRDEDAFAALVARHGPMVLGVCRRILRDDRDVEDAFQATFLVLVRRAGSIRDGELVGRWLHGVAHRVAVRARAHAARRFVHEQSVEGPVESGADIPASAAAERRELATIVDEEVGRLPPALRAPVVLCYLEGLSHDEAARRLGWPVGTVRSRMARARDVLRHRLARRGVAADGATIVAALARPAIPPGWLDATVRHSLDFANHTAAAAAAVASTRAAGLARKVLTTMILTKIRSLGAVGLVGVVLVLGGVRTLAVQDRAEAGPGDTAPAARGKAGAGPENKRKPSSQPGARISPEVALEWEIATREGELWAREKEVKDLTARIAALREMLANRSPAAPTARTEPGPGSARLAEATAPPKAPAGQGDEAGDPARPRYFYLEATSPGEERKIVIISPDGARVATFEPRTGKSTPLKLPAIRGVRREILPRPTHARQLPAPKQVKAAFTPWFFAMDLDQGHKVTRIAAFDVSEGTWAEAEAPDPVERSAVKIHLGNVFRLGRRLYALSPQARRWGVLELPPGTDAEPYVFFDSLMVEVDGHLHRFDTRTGTWVDLYARTVGGGPDSPPR